MAACFLYGIGAGLRSDIGILLNPLADLTHSSYGQASFCIAAIFGALLSGCLSTKASKGKLLAFYYGFRAVWVLCYIFFMPKTFGTSVLFSIGLGFTGDATVSPTAGLVNTNFNAAQAATLRGVLFLVHQIGGFPSAWLGGLAVGATGGYTFIWIMGIALCTFAAIASRLIVTKRGRS